LRVLLFAHCPDGEAAADDGAAPQLPAPLTPLGLVALSDELRPEATATLRRFEEAGVGLKIISGDHPQTVAALARQAGFTAKGTGRDVVSGEELATLTDKELARTVCDASIFGRINPEQKETMVRLLRAEGHYVAMTGDGVNDALALKEANLGIAMQSGSQATRHVADIVLLDDSFAALPHVLLEGQRILHGMHDILRLYLTRILCLSLLVLSVGIIGIGFPFTPPQSAFISTITLTVPSVLLGLWARPGPVPQGRLIRKLMHFVIPAVLSVTVAGLAVYIIFLQRAPVPGQSTVATAQEALMLAAIACGLVLIIFVEPPTPFWVGGDTFSGDRRPALLALGLLLLATLAHATDPVRRLYGFLILRPEDYLIIGGVVLIWALMVRFIWRARLVERYLHVEFDG
jgi:cation-transporting ATPase E